MFGDQKELIVVYNMGQLCQYCTLWADGLNGLTKHLQKQAAFALVSTDKPEQQVAFAESWNWQFPMFSHAGSSFSKDMGFLLEEGQMPGLSVFTKDDLGITYRSSHAFFVPGDNFNVMWDIMDMLPSAWNNWAPKLHY